MRRRGSHRPMPTPPQSRRWPNYRFFRKVSSTNSCAVLGRVEVLRKGQSQWVPAVVGDRLVEGDDIRSFAGGQAEVALLDRSGRGTSGTTQPVALLAIQLTSPWTRRPATRASP